MTQQEIRQQARRAALDAATQARRARADRDRRLQAMAVRVLVAVRERDAAVTAAERRAGHALREMTDQEGLTLREAVAWCGGELTPREAARLRRLGTTRHDGGTGDTEGVGEGDGDPEPVGADPESA
jgi:hypothetical protein